MTSCYARIGILLVVGLAPLGVEAASLTSLYMFSAFSTTPSPPGGVVPPFTFTGTGGVSLTLNASGVAVGQANVGSAVTRDIDATVVYQSHGYGVDVGEPGSMPKSVRVNAEVGKMDDVGFVAEASDAALNIDFSTGAWVTLKLPTDGFSHLIIAEDAGLDPFKLTLCGNASCSTSGGAPAPQVIFNGFDAATRSAVLARGDFGSGDISPIDQVYLFEFAAPVTGWIRISQTTNFGGTNLEVDFVGGGTEELPPIEIEVPEPTTLLLWGTTALGLGAIRWRRHRRAA